MTKERKCRKDKILNAKAFNRTRQTVDIDVELFKERYEYRNNGGFDVDANDCRISTCIRPFFVIADR